MEVTDVKFYKKGDKFSFEVRMDNGDVFTSRVYGKDGMRKSLEIVKSAFFDFVTSITDQTKQSS